MKWRINKIDFDIKRCFSAIMILFLAFFFLSCGMPGKSGNKIPKDKEKYTEEKKAEQKKKELKQIEKLKEVHRDNQTKKTQKRMKKKEKQIKRRQKRRNKGKVGEPFWWKWFGM